MLYIVLTFDYELFFGTNKGTYSSVLFEPTERLINVLKNECVSATFFADTCSVVQATKYQQDDYVTGFTNQIQSMVSAGQDVQLHIHPHWIKSDYDGTKWNFNNDFYRIHEFGAGEESISSIIKCGIDYLNGTLKPIDHDYTCIAYRAGGFCIQPHAEIIEILYKYGIRIDSSVAPHLKSSNATHVYDYCRNELKSNWSISSGKEWWEDGKDDQFSLFEIPIATVDKNPFAFVLKRLINPDRIKLHLEEIRGTYINSSNLKGKKNLQAGIKSIWNYFNGYNAISMDAYKAEYINAQIQRLYGKHKCDEKDVYVALIGHPKLVTTNYLENLKDLIKFIKTDERIRVVSVSDIWRREGRE